MSQIDSLRELLEAETNPTRITAYEKQIAHLEAIEEEQTYRVDRVYQVTGAHEVIATGLTLEEAQKHCSRPDTSGGTWPDVWADVFYAE